jgi:hypothetical protein
LKNLNTRWSITELSALRYVCFTSVIRRRTAEQRDELAPVASSLSVLTGRLRIVSRERVQLLERPAIELQRKMQNLIPKVTQSCRLRPPVSMEKAYHWHRRLLCLRRERPRDRAVEQLMNHAVSIDGIAVTQAS